MAKVKLKREEKWDISLGKIFNWKSNSLSHMAYSDINHLTNLQSVDKQKASRYLMVFEINHHLENNF